MASLDAYDVNPEGAHIQHDPGTTPEQRAKGLSVASTYYWPHASMTVTYVDDPSKSAAVLTNLI